MSTETCQHPRRDISNGCIHCADCYKLLASTESPKRNWHGSTVCENFLYGNNTPADLGPWHKAIVQALTTTGSMPEELADLFVAVPVPGGNPDGSPRFVINAI